MADFVTAFQWMIESEDSRQQCAVVPDSTPAGAAGPCFAISGINSGSYPGDYASIAALPQGSRLAAVEAFYKKQYWSSWYDQLVSDDLAKRVFDFAVNGGPGTAVKTLQRAVNSLGGNLTVDGGWGPMTLAAVNAANQAALVQAFVNTRVAYYQLIAANNPANAQFLQGWIARAEKQSA
jgi:lysozyme family protein